MTGVPVSPLAHVVRSFAFVQKSPNHLGRSQLFEAFDPSLVRAKRREVTDSTASRPAPAGADHGPGFPDLQAPSSRRPASSPRETPVTEASPGRNPTDNGGPSAPGRTGRVDAPPS
jgi:hypothetical protein